MASPTGPGRLLALVLALALGGCDSTIHMTGAPANAPLGADAGVPATVAAGVAGQAVTIDNPGLLPQAVRQAANLKVSFGGVLVPVSRANGGQYVFSIPASARVQQDVSGNLAVVFVMDDRTSQIVSLRTGSPVAFGQPAILTTPSPAFLVKGLSVHLKANTQADPARYQFTWNFGPSPQGPFAPIAGTGSELDWTPPAAGNFYIRVDAVDRTNQQVFSATTPDAIVFVSDAKTVITTNPAAGSVQRGQPIALSFNQPAGLTSTNLAFAWSYGPSPMGPFQSIAGSGATVSFLPTNAGSYYVHVDVTDQSTGKVYSFVGPDPSVYVSEGQPVIKVSGPTALRGDKVTLGLNIPNPGNGPFAWYYTVAGAAASFSGPSFTRIPGNGATVDFYATDVGSYTFRVDVPQTDGSIKTFTSTDPQLNVSEPVPVIVSNPAKAVTAPGNNIELDLNAAGIDPTQFRFTWYAGPSGQGPFVTLPPNRTEDYTTKTFIWRIPAQTSYGNYYIRVDASRIDGSATYTFISSTPVVTVANPNP